MIRRNPGPQDDAIQVDQDLGWQGVDLRTDPGLLPPGLGSDALNCSFRLGMPHVRPSIESHAWGHDYGIANLDNIPDMDDFNFDQPVGFGKQYGARDFKMPGGTAMTLIAVSYGVWRIAPNAPPQLLRVWDQGTGGLITGPVEFVPCFNVVLLCRGNELETLVWDPQTQDVAGGDGFRIPTPEPWDTVNGRNPDPANSYGDGTQEIPPGPTGVLMGNRFWPVFDGDQMGASDILDYTRINVAQNEVRINAGDSDQIVRPFPAGQAQMLVLKDNSIYMLSGVVGDLSTLAVNVISLATGLAAKWGVAQWGNDVVFLAGRGRGLYSITATVQGLLQAGSEALSAPIQPLMDRINWAQASGACLATHNGMLFLAVPIDGANYNNAIFVYDSVTAAWAGMWSADFLDVAMFTHVKVCGEWRLGWVTGSGTMNTAWWGVVCTLGADLQDQFFGQPYAIDWFFATRGYSFIKPTGNYFTTPVEWKRFLAVRLELETCGANYRVDVRVQGVNAVTPLIPDTAPDRTQSTRFAGKPYVPGNPNLDHDDPNREDYAIPLNDFPLLFGADGVTLELFQQYSVRRRLRARGRWLRLEVTNTAGAVRLLVAGVHGTNTAREDVTRV